MSEHALHLDCESRSTVELSDVGVHAYAESPTTDVLCVAFALNDHPVKCWHPGEPVPDEIRKAVDCGWTLVAFNAAFERTLWREILGPRYGWPIPKLSQWQCVMVQALAMSLPGSLKNATRAVGIDDGGKADAGRVLMLQMCKPRKARKGEDPNILHWWDDDERRQKLAEVCAKDVEDERELEKRLLQLRPSEQSLWQLDQRINDRGVYVDIDLCNAAQTIVDQATTWLNDEIHLLTDEAVRATTNVAQIAKWCREQGFQTTSLAKDAVEEILARKDLTPVVRRVLEIRREAAKASVKKIDALLLGRSKNGRAKGLLQFHAAGTGRWAGRRFQPQNIKRPDLDDIDGAIAAVGTGNAEYVRVVYGEPLSVVGDCLRGMVRAAPGNVLYAADFSNIEGRAQAWLAGEEWKLEAFKQFDAGLGADLYKVAYGRAFGIAPEKVDGGAKSGPQRQIGKVMELALGYQGGVGAFQKMAVGYGVEVSDERAEELKTLWREAHPNIKQCWWDLENAGRSAIEHRGKTFHVGPISFRCAGSFLFMRLPSGRCITYPYPCLKSKLMPWKDSAGRPVWKESICYKGVDTFTHQWTDCFAHGGLLFNNAVQGLARDLEAEAIIRVEAKGYYVILSVHDEVVCETRAGFGSVEEFEQLMTVLPAWAEGLPVAANAWVGPRYKKG